MNGKGMATGVFMAGKLILAPYGEADAQYVSRDAYEAREMKYVMQYPFHVAAYPSGDTGKMPYAIEAGLFTEEFMDMDMPYPFIEIGAKAFPKVAGVPLWAELKVPPGEFPADMLPYLMLGPRFDKLQKDGKFYFLAGIELRGIDVKGVKAYITAISDGGYFVDFIPSIGRGTEMVKGTPKLTSKLAFDSYMTAGKILGKDGKTGSIGVSTDFENGQFRNVSLRYGRNGVTAGVSYNIDSEMPGIDFSFRTLIDTHTKREKLGLPSKREMRQKYHPRNRPGHRGQ